MSRLMGQMFAGIRMSGRCRQIFVSLIGNTNQSGELFLITFAVQVGYMIVK